jgi:hypothetical protein
MFADDSNVFSSGPNPKNIETLLNAEIPLLIDWLRDNRLSLNVDKMHIMIFGPLPPGNLIPLISISRSKAKPLKLLKRPSSWD